MTSVECRSVAARRRIGRTAEAICAKFETLVTRRNPLRKERGMTSLEVLEHVEDGRTFLAQSAHGSVSRFAADDSVIH
jgi:hypothetical protein